MVSPEAWGGLTVLAVALLREGFTLWDHRQRRIGRRRTRRQDSDNPSRSASEVELLDLLQQRDL